MQFLYQVSIVAWDHTKTVNVVIKFLYHVSGDNIYCCMGPYRFVPS